MTPFREKDVYQTASCRTEHPLPTNYLHVNIPKYNIALRGFTQPHNKTAFYSVSPAIQQFRVDLDSCMKSCIFFAEKKWNQNPIPSQVETFRKSRFTSHFTHLKYDCDRGWPYGRLLPVVVALALVALCVGVVVAFLARYGSFVLFVP